MNCIFQETRIAEESLTTKAGYAVKEGTAADSMVLGSAGAAMGVLIQKNVASGESGTVMRLGICEFAVSDGSSVNIAIGDPLTSNASGKWVKCTTSGHQVVARARDASTADGTLIRIELLGEYPLA